MGALNNNQSWGRWRVYNHVDILITIIIIIIALNGAIQDFWQSPLCSANCLQHARSSGPGAIVCKSRATHRALITCNMCCVPRGTKGQLNRIYFSFILLTEPLNRRRMGGNQITERKPKVMSVTKCHILQPEDSSPKRDSNPHNSRLAKQIC